MPGAREDTVAIDVMPARRRFTIKQYEKMVATGILAQDDRVELIDGEIIEMGPMSVPHPAIVTNLTHLLMPRVEGRAWVWVQAAVRVPPRSMPQPDLALLRLRSYMRKGPTTADALLFIEVADTSLQYDRTVKLRLYARAGIPEYWIVDENTETVEVYRAPSGEQYVDRQALARGETFAPLACPDATIPVDPIFF
jgi:Uma2 family endonuclease